MLWRLIRFVAAALVLSAICSAQEEPSLGDLARQERARKAAARAAAGPVLGTAPPVAVAAEVVPAHFLRFEGEVGPGDYAILLNGRIVLQNGRVRGLPFYVTPYLLDGNNLLGLQFTSEATHPFDVVVEERWSGQSERRELVHFHADPNQFPETTRKQFDFTAHPVAVPNVKLTDADRVSIRALVQSFYNALSAKNGTAILRLFEPAIEDARSIYPEGAEFGRNEMAGLAHIAELPNFAMEAYDPSALEMTSAGNIVSVKRLDGKPVLLSNEVSADPQSAPSRVSADVIPVKKIKGVWRLTLPFGF